MVLTNEKGGDAATKGIGVMTGARWQKIYEFLAKADLLPKDLDYKKAYTLEFVNKGVGKA